MRIKVRRVDTRAHTAVRSLSHTRTLAHVRSLPVRSHLCGLRLPADNCPFTTRIGGARARRHGVEQPLHARGPPQHRQGARVDRDHLLLPA
eukprot:6917171-Prymnesium_polylepis.1